MLPAIPALLLLSACNSPAPDPEPGSVYGCGEDGRLEVELYGGISASLDWRADELACEGMPRPNDEGARLRLSGPLGTGPGAKNVAFIIALPDLQEGQPGSELPTNVTLMEEGSGRFFATRDTSGCWTDVTSQDPVGNGNGPEYRISGMLYCVSPLAELNGGSSISFTNLKFTGRLTWKPPE